MITISNKLVDLGLHLGLMAVRPLNLTLYSPSYGKYGDKQLPLNIFIYFFKQLKMMRKSIFLNTDADFTVFGTVSRPMRAVNFVSNLYFGIPYPGVTVVSYRKN